MPNQKLDTSDTEKKDSTTIKIFNYIGSALIFFGIAYFISANWGLLNNFVKIFSTLGTAIAAFCIAALLHQTEKFRTAESAFFMLAGLVLPIGLYVTFDIAHLSFSQNIPEILISGICLTVFLISFYVLPGTIFLLFSIIFGSFLFANLVDYLSLQTDYILINLFEYEMIVLGLAYIFLGYYLNFDKRYPLTGPLYFFGSLLVLSSSYFLGSAFFFSNALVYWKVITAIFIMLAFLLAVPLKSKSFLYFGAIFLVIYVTDMSYKFAAVFGDLGWSLILVIIGLSFMIIGYLVFFIHRKMQKKNERIKK
jgi:hypothetical protein